MHHSCVVISSTNGSETLTSWHCFEDTSRVFLRFKLTAKLYHPNFLRKKKTKHIKQAENKENKKVITCEISWVITLTKEYLFLISKVLFFCVMQFNTVVNVKKRKKREREREREKERKEHRHHSNVVYFQLMPSY